MTKSSTLRWTPKFKPGSRFCWVAWAAAQVITAAIAVPARAGGEIVADAPLQAAIQALADAPGRAEIDDKMNRIRALVGRDTDRLIAQLLFYDASKADSESARACVGRILDELRIPRESAVSALVAHLENTNPLIARMVRNLLRGYEDRSATRPPDFSTYRSIIEAHVRVGKEPSEALVKHIYESDPGSALLTMMRGYQLRDPGEMKPILWAEHVIADMFWKRQYGFIGPQESSPAVATELESLSRHPRWWVRLYVAELINHHPELRRPELFDRLKADTHPLVRAALITD